MASENTTNYLDFSVTAQDGSTVPLSTYAGKVLLVVNTATGCGFTPQYEDLERIYAAHKDQALESWTSPATSLPARRPSPTTRSTSSARSSSTLSSRASRSST